MTSTTQDNSSASTPATTKKTASKPSTAKRTTNNTTAALALKLLTFILSIVAAYLLSQSSQLSRLSAPILNKLPASFNLKPLTANILSRPFSAPTAAMTNTPRTIAKVVKANSQSEGAGARVRRSIGTPQLRNLSPFLMLDHFSIKRGAGFPDHPHRGQETITYLLSGSVDHEDFAGHKGTIGPGDLQFMTAGRGIVHAEMPGSGADSEGGENTGMQLWVDLPKELKFCEPRYRDLRAEEIPLAKSEDGKVEVKVISGEALGVESLKDLAYTPVWFLDVLIKEGGEIFQKIPKGWNSFAYTLSGETTFTNGTGEGSGKKKVPEYHTVVFGREETGDGVKMSNPVGSGGDARIILVAGVVLDQPVVQYGPFVLNTQDQVYEALRDYQNSKNGFERARGWRSEIGKSMDF